ncbi:M56 family metallopeptidase [soil metagenome]
MSLYLPLLLSAVFGVTAPLLAHRLPPQIATWMLSIGGLFAAAGSSVTLGLLAFDALAQDPRLAARFGWSEGVLRAHHPVDVEAGAVAAAAVALFAVRFLIVGARRAGSVRQAHRLAAALSAGGGELSVIPSADRRAFAVPGRPGRIAVTTGMLRSLDGSQRRALLAHERSHLLHHHHLHHTAVHLAASVNPLLRALPSASALATERWADEDAASVARRDTVAEALTRAATGGHPAVGGVVLAAAAADVADRVDALRAPPPRLALWRIGVSAMLLLAIAAAVAVAMHDTERLFELAQDAYRAGHR